MVKALHSLLQFIGRQVWNIIIISGLVCLIWNISQTNMTIGSMREELSRLRYSIDSERVVYKVPDFGMEIRMDRKFR